jgi:hypothetical protein
MNFEQAMQHVINGGKSIRAKWRHSEEFFRIYVSSNIKSVNLTQSEFDEVKNQLIVSYLDAKDEKIQPILQTVVREFSSCSFLYVFNEEDANANDWEIYQGDQE